MAFYLIGNSEREKIKCIVKPEEYAAVLFSKVEQRLKWAHIKYIQKEKFSISFVGTPLRFAGIGFDLFNGISKGKINIEYDNSDVFVSHNIFFFEYFVIALLFTIIPALGLAPSLMFRILFIILIWCIYIIVSFITIYRFNSYLAETLRETNINIADYTEHYNKAFIKQQP